MKASDLIKVEFDIEAIYKEIESANKRGECMYFIPPFTYITDETKLALMRNGFKCYDGDFGVYMKGFIIEW